MEMPDHDKYELLPDECVEGEETISPEELFNGIMAGLNEALEWERGNTKARITEYIDGERIGPEWLTKAEFDARQAARECPSLIYDPSADAMALRIKQAKIDTSDEIMPGVTVDYDSDGKIVGIKILDISERIKTTEKTEAA